MILANSYSITSQDASLPLLLATFTPTISGEYFANVNLSLLAGTGVYRFTTTRQIGGVGAIYQSATAAVGVSAGITTLMISTIPTPLLAGDVLKIYVQGLAGDTAIDGVTEIFRSDTINEIQSGLALEATLTAIKGAGWTTETLVKIVTDIAAISAGSGATAQEVWEYVTRTLTQSPAEIVATVLGTGITQIRGNSWAVQLTGVVLESTQQFAIKYNATQPDSAALLFVDSVNGLTVLNGVAQDGEDSSKASLTYDGTILTLTVDASITAQLPVGGWQYGIQSVSDNGIVAEPYGGSFRVLADVVRAID